MKKVFISVPMKGRTDEHIRESIGEMHKLAEIMFGETLEPIDNFVCEGEIPKDCNVSIYFLSKAIEKLSKADYFIGVNYTGHFSGCNIESNVANSYNIPTMYMNMHDCAFLADAVELERRRWDSVEATNYPTKTRG